MTRAGDPTPASARAPPATRTATRLDDVVTPAGRGMARLRPGVPSAATSNISKRSRPEPPGASSGSNAITPRTVSVTAVGEVVAIDNFGAGDILEIAKPDGKRFMVPMNDKAVPAWTADGVTIAAAFIE